jgi:type IV pilus assembly protein PilB
MMMFNQERQLGQLLVTMGKLDADDLDQALREHHKTGDRLGSVLTKMGLVSEDDVQRTLAEQLQLPFVKISEMQVRKSIITT